VPVYFNVLGFNCSGLAASLNPGLKTGAVTASTARPFGEPELFTESQNGVGRDR